MKKTAILGFFIVLMMGLAACSSDAEETEVGGLASVDTSSSEGSQVADSEAKVSGLSDAFEGALSIQAQLIAGTFKLEGTDLAVDLEQAGTLLPLWKAYYSLSQSDTAAEVEIAAVIKQIQDSMTAE